MQYIQHTCHYKEAFILNYRLISCSMAAEWSCLYQNCLQSLLEPSTNESLFCCHVREWRAGPEYDKTDLVIPISL